MGFLVRLFLSVVLVVGGSLASASASVRPVGTPCHETISHHHATVAADACRPRVDHLADHCPTALGLCCCPAMLAPMATDVALARHVTVVTWTAAPIYDLSGRPPEPATPPPRI